MNLAAIIRLHFGAEKTIEEAPLANLIDREIDLCPEDLAVHIYRIQHRIAAQFGEEKYGVALKRLSFIQRMYTQIEIYYSAVIGDDFRIIHGLGTVIGARVVIGNHVSVHQNVTLGWKVTHSNLRPVIGDDVIICAGAKIVGDVRIGKGSIVGANAVVLESFADHSVIAGVPARVIKKKADAGVPS